MISKLTASPKKIGKALLPISAACFYLLSTTAYSTVPTESDKTKLYLEFGSAIPKSDTIYEPTLPTLSLVSGKVTAPNSCNGSVGLSITNAFTDGTLKKIYENFTTILNELASTDGLVYLASVYVSKSNPHVYQFLTEGISVGVEDFMSSIGSCEAISEAIVDRASDVVKMQRATKLNTIIEHNAAYANQEWSDIDITDYVRKGMDAAAEAGITWFGGKRGGADQDPVDLVPDTIKYGWCVLKGWKTTTCDDYIANDGTIDSSTLSDNEKQLFEKIDDMTRAGITILGNKYLSICTGCETIDVEGVGLKVYIQSLQNKIYELIKLKAARDITTLTENDYQQVSYLPMIQADANYFKSLSLVQDDSDLYDLYAYGWAYDVAYQRGLAMLDTLEDSIKASLKTTEVDSSGLGEPVEGLVKELESEREKLYLSSQQSDYTPKKYIKMLLNVSDKRTENGAIGSVSGAGL